MHAFAGLPATTQFAVVVITLAALAFHAKWTRRTIALGPTILTTLGIFFCFLGIALGLMEFDPNDVRTSVPYLLNGIRTSFWASVTGIFWALTLKARVAFLGDPKIPTLGSQEGATVADLARLLVALNKSIAGTEDSTVLSQLKLQRSDCNDRLDRLAASFNRFAEKMAEANSKALISALSEVIRDFNTKLNEQFGDNFKQLNQAVERLVTWQVQYERQLNALIERETQTRKSMTEASLRYAELVNRSATFSEVANALKVLLETTLTQKEQLRVLLSDLSELINKAGSGLPTIEQKIGEMTRQIEAGVKSNIDTLGAALKTSAQSIQIHNQQLTTALTNTIETANKELNAHLRQAAEDSKKHIVALDRALETELTKAIETLGRQLAALSEKFVQDYTPLTDRLQRVVRIAESVSV